MEITYTKISIFPDVLTKIPDLSRKVKFPDFSSFPWLFQRVDTLVYTEGGSCARAPSFGRKKIETVGFK